MSDRVYSKEEVVAATIEYFEGDELAATTWVKKYALRDKQDNLLEKTPEDMHRRLAKEFARIESKYPNPLSEGEIFEWLREFKYIVPQGSPMSGIGNNYKNLSLSNCVVIESPKDNVSSIFDTARDMANLFKRRCGVGVDLSELRPEGMPVNNSAGSTTGAWSFADFYSSAGRLIGQGGRRAAEMISLDVRHPDVFKFVTMKKDLTKVTGANISVRLRNDFMEAVKNNSEYVLQFPVESDAPTYSKRIKAKELWDLIIKTATETAEPGLLFWDNIIDNLPAHCYPEFKTVSVNPCVVGETIIETNAGAMRIDELAKANVVFKTKSFNEQSKQIEFKPAVAFATKKNARVLKINTKDGKQIMLTPNHLVYTPRGWVAAGELTPADKILKI